MHACFSCVHHGLSDVRSVKFGRVLNEGKGAAEPLGGGLKYSVDQSIKAPHKNGGQQSSPCVEFPLSDNNRRRFAPGEIITCVCVSLLSHVLAFLTRCAALVLPPSLSVSTVSDMRCVGRRSKYGSMLCYPHRK